MKKYLILAILTIAFRIYGADVNIFTQPTPVPTASPKPLTNKGITEAQQYFVKTANLRLSINEKQIERAYADALSIFAPGGGLTTEQKLAALTPTQKTAVITLAWQLYNAIKTANPTTEVPSPNVAIPTK